MKKPKFGDEEDTTPSGVKRKRGRPKKQKEDNKSSTNIKINATTRPVMKKKEILKPKN